MADVAGFALNPFQENTYIVFDETGECVIFDPGCNNADEEKVLTDFIESKKLTPVRLINTHCHIDHVLGNKFIAEKYKLGLEIHKGELPVLAVVEQVGQMYGIPVTPSPQPSAFIEEGDTIEFGSTKLDVLFTPGHSPASISFFSKPDKFIIAGDVLFQRSIGRYDLPGGDLEVLTKTILEKFYTLGDDVTVFPGHGPHTTIGEERKLNQFVRG